MRPLVREGAERWERLASLVKDADTRGLRSLSSDQLDELARLYRRTASDLARARSRDYEPALLHHLNDLVGRAAGLIYGGRRKRRFRAGVFFFSTVPRTFRATLVYTATATALFLLAALLAASLTSREPAWADELTSPQIREVVERFVASDAPSGQYFSDTQAMMGADQLSGMIVINNIKVALIAFAMGMTFAAGTVWVLISNGMMLGAFVGVGAYHDRLMDLIAIVAPHGVLELSAIFICAGAGLMIGWALIAPGDRLRVDALSRAAREAVALVVGCIPLFAVAALIEGVFSPQTSGLMRENPERILLGLATGLGLALYLLYGGRSESSPDENATESLVA